MRLANPFKSLEFRRLFVALLVSGLLHLLLIAALLPNLDDYVLASTGTDGPIVLKARFDAGQRASGRATKLEPDRVQQHEPTPLSEPANEFSPTRQLDKRPRVIGTVDLDIPESERLTEAGTLVLKLWIGATGRVEKVEVDKSSLPKAFADAAAEVFRRVKFEPGEIDGRPVGSILMIEVRHNADSDREPVPGGEPSQ